MSAAADNPANLKGKCISYYWNCSQYPDWVLQDSWCE